MTAVALALSACSFGSAGSANGPVPPGTAQDQAVAALHSVGLSVSASVSVSSTASVPAGRSAPLPSGVHYFPGIRVVVTNHGSVPLTYPFSFTFVRWDGTSWVHLPCLDEDSPPATICGLASNQQTLPPGATDPLTTAVLAEDSPPGTYAVICASLAEIADYPGYSAVDGAATIFTLTANH